MGSIVASDYYGMARRNTAGIYSHYGGTHCSNQNQKWCVKMGEYIVFGSIVGSDYYGMARRNSAGIYSHFGGTYCSNQDLIWCVNMGEYIVFGSIVGSDYYGMASVILPVFTVITGEHTVVIRTKNSV